MGADTKSTSVGVPSSLWDHVEEGFHEIAAEQSNKEQSEESTDKLE